MPKNVGIELKESSISSQFIKEVSDKRNLKLDDIQVMLKANVLTPMQLARIVNRDINTINNLIRVNRMDDNSGLTEAYPYPVSKEKLGPMFILVDNKCILYIKQCLNIE